MYINVNTLKLFFYTNILLDWVDIYYGLKSNVNVQEKWKF